MTAATSSVLSTKHFFITLSNTRRVRCASELALRNLPARTVSLKNWTLTI